ncbi:MAG: transglutaminase family protein [Pseudomonadota bacterium]
MQLTVAHTTVYRFEKPRDRVVQSHRLQPASAASQKVNHWDVSCDGASFGASFVDGAGDWVSTMTLAGPVRELVIHVNGSVETTDTTGVLRGHREIVAPDVYLRKTRTTAPGVGLNKLAERLSGSHPHTLEGAHAMASLVADTVVYAPGVTHSQMTAAEVVELGRGVCQDHSQVLIAIARILGVPARYVTGYLFADASGASHEASHAWAELYVRDLGWVGFDAANQCCPDERYIRLGSGMDALDAAPIRGISLGGGKELLEIAVTVSAQQ